MTADLARLPLDFERAGRDARTWSQTHRNILVAAVDANLAKAKPSLRDIANAGGIPPGTVKSARSRDKNFRADLDAIGRGPHPTYFDDDDGVTRCRRFAESQPRWAWTEWERLYGCARIHPVMDADEPNSYENAAPKVWEMVPGRVALERLWGDSAEDFADLLDACHRAAFDPMPYQKELLNL
jgi:hypothetical protein